MSQEDKLDDQMELPEAEPEAPTEEAAAAVVEEDADEVEAAPTGQSAPELAIEEPALEEEEPAAAEGLEQSQAEMEPALTQAEAPTAPAVASRREQRGGCLRLFLVGLLSVLGGAFLTLLILWLANGTLDFRTATNRAIRAEAFRLDGEMGALSAEIGQLRDRVQEMEGMATQLDQAQADIQTVKDGLLGMETQLQEVEADLAAAEAALSSLKTGAEKTRTDVTELQGRAGAIEDRLEVVSQELREVRQTAQRFDTFLSGLRELLNAPQGQMPLPSAAPVTSTPVSPGPAQGVTPGPRITVIPLTTPTPTAAP